MKTYCSYKTSYIVSVAYWKESFRFVRKLVELSTVVSLHIFWIENIKFWEKIACDELFMQVK